ncbi:hypothetical protein KO500_15900 [Cellulophaga baltica]|uniref:hypothetical protein n=1 Tax=Cellulophaga TaxID=104264 RepID=UPI001C07C332|nr:MULTISPECIES: hypothetical protein [Cellulophaga]MBU2997926.1 hypothetical protein [Cellulophaga baltica]MDO6769327.1 hypothetical protein [Cellulophaga sp. 1_MG-2023]
MKNKPVHIIQQNLLLPLGVILVIVASIFGLFYLVDFYGHPPRSWKYLILGIATIGLTFQIFVRLSAWELILYDDKAVLKKPFGVLKNNRKEFKYNEIEEAGFLQGFRMNASLRVDFKSGKKYNIFLDKNLIEISKVLIFLENSDVKVGLYCDNRIKQKLKKDGLKTA